MYLWVKEPGVSDGQCGTDGPKSGTWYPALAHAIYQNTVKTGSVPILPLP